MFPVPFLIKRLLLAATLFTGAGALQSQAHADTFTVNNTSDSDGTCTASSCSLREAIKATNSNQNFGVTDTIFILPTLKGTINVNSAADDGAYGSTAFVLRQDVSIQGVSSSELVVRRSGVGNFRLFRISGGARVQIGGLAYANGVASSNASSYASHGGAFYNEGTLIIANAILDGNTALSSGGAIANAAGGTAYLENCQITNNSATASAGGIFNAYGGNFTMLRGTIANNSSAQGSGGVQNVGNMTLQTSTISGNTSNGTGVGGGLTSTGSLQFFNSTLSGNSVSAGNNNGAGLWTSGTTNITNCTITANSAGGASSASGVFQQSGTTTLSNTIVAANANSASIPDVTGTFSSNGYNLIGNAGSVTAFTVAGDQTGDSSTPLDPKLRPLQFSGGFNQTHGLLTGSPAIDAGNSFLTTDQRSFGRPFNLAEVADAPGSNGSDIGAFELSEEPQLPPSFLVNSLDDHDDGVCGPTDCTLREAINASNNSAATAPQQHIISFADNVRGTIDLKLRGTEALEGTAFVLSGNTSIQGPGAKLLTVRRASDGGNFRLFYLPAGSTTHISGLTLSNGSGAIYCANQLTLSDCRISDNSGPGILVGHTLATLTMQNCTASGNGGSGVVNKGTAIIINCMFSGNSGESGGGIHNTGTLTVRSSTFTGNQGSGPNSGGGIYTNGVASISNSTISENAVSSYWAGCGGGLRTGGNTIIANCTITNNYSQGPGNADGIVADSGTKISNSIVAANGSQPFSHDVLGSFVSGGYNLIGNIGDVSAFNAEGDQTGRDSTPLDPQLGPLLTDNGGVTQTYALLSGSPAINAGNPSFNTVGLPFDQRGEGFGRVRGGRLDMGAFEVQNPTPVVPSVITVTIDNTSPKTNDILTAIPRAGQSNGGTLSYSYVWKKNDIIIPSETTSKLNLSKAGNGDKGDSITCTVVVREGTSSGVPVTSAAVVVQNTAPVVANAVIRPSAPKTNDFLHVNIGSITDADGDIIDTKYHWIKNGVALEGGESTVLKLQEVGNGDRGDKISVTITFSDGTDSGSLTLDPVTIVNSAPLVTWSLFISVPTTRSTLKSVIAQSQDADGDTISIKYVWRKNGVVLSRETGPTLDLSKPGNGDKDDKITLTLTYSDGLVAGISETRQVTVVNTVPHFSPRAITATENTTLSGQLVGSDADGDTLSYSVAYNTRYGKLVLQSNGAFTYTPNPNWNGTDLFNVRATDTSGGSATGAVSIVVRPVNRPPVAVADFLRGMEDVPISIAASTLLSNDQNGEAPNEADALKIVRVTVPVGFPGILRLDVAQQTLLFTPKPNWNGTTSFSYTVQDSGRTISSAQVTLQIVPVNDAPVALGGRMTVLSGSLGELPLLGSDVEGDALTFFSAADLHRVLLKCSGSELIGTCATSQK